MSDNSLLQDFITETGEHLDETERNLLRLEQQPDDVEALNKIFRSVHTIKGSAEYLGMERIAELSHKLENLLDLLRRGELRVNASIIELLISCNDRIVDLIDELGRHEQEKSSIDDLISAIEESAKSAKEQDVDSDIYDDDEEEDEYDQELFGIFAEQLKEGLNGLVEDAGRLRHGEDGLSVLETGMDRLNTLRSSSNYMGYDELKEVYENWSLSIDQVVASIQNGEDVDLEAFSKDTMLANTNRIKAMFPKVFDAADEGEIVEPGQADDDATEEIAEEDVQESQNLLADFITETSEHLEHAERNLLKLEKQPDDMELLNKLFRSVHTIKGSSEYLGMVNIASLSHKLEGLLDLMRRGEYPVDNAVIDLMMSCNDRINELVSEIDKYKEERSSVDDLISRLAQDVDEAGTKDAEAETEGVGEAYGDDEYDKELFEIFANQLKEGLDGLDEDVKQLQEGDDIVEVLERSVDRLNMLRSSSNYMGYDELKELYEKWSLSLEQTIEACKSEDEVDIESFSKVTMSANIDHVKTLFPNISFDSESEIRQPAPPAEEKTEIEAYEKQQDQEEQDTDQSLLADFIAETGEHLEETEHNLLELEKQPEDLDLLNEIFRSVHTIKGSSEYLGMVRIAELAHRLESLLDKLRHGERSVDNSIIDLLMNCHDRIGILIEDLDLHHEERENVEDLLVRLEALLTDDAEVVETRGTVEKLVIEDNTGALYVEEYDKELFGIFLEQFQTSLQALIKETEQLSNGASIDDVIDRCVKLLNALRSSANYMEYNELRDVYDQWIERLVDISDQHKAGDPFNIETFNEKVMMGNIEKVKSFFSSLKPVSFSYEDDTPVDSGVNVDPEEIPSSDVDKILLDKLSSAFDSRLGTVEEDKEVAAEDMEESLFSDDMEITTPSVEALTDDGEKWDTDSDLLDIDDVESLLFTESSNKPAKDKILPEPFTSTTPKRSAQPEPFFEKTRQSSDRYNLGRRKSDKFHERMLKQSIRVDSAKIDSLMNQVGELVVSRSGFNQLFSEMRELQLILKQSQQLDGKAMQAIKSITNRINEATTTLGRVTSELQENVMKVRMLPIAQLFSRYPRLVHDLVKNTDKKVNLEIYGEETELDKKVIEQLADPLIHIIRNAVDHGIEDITGRRKKGKEESGTIRLEAYHESNYVVVEISDDGRGIDAEKVKQSAIEKGFVTHGETSEMPDDEALTLIMRPGFSTASEVTHTSGRGVGMDVVKDSIEKMNGAIDIYSNVGVGARFRIRIPLTLAIIPALLVRVMEEIFTIPLSTVDETIRISKTDISTIEGLEVYSLRENTIPLIRLKDVFNMGGDDKDKDEYFVVIVNAGSRQLGIVVDELRSRQEVVIKPLEDYLQEKSGFSGATILGDGNISLIIDVFELVQLSLSQHVQKVKIAAP